MFLNNSLQNSLLVKSFFLRMAVIERKKRQIYAEKIFFSNFAAMSINAKRKTASWILLAIFLPMLLLASLHTHDSNASSHHSSIECVDHHCSGHLIPYSANSHVCVVCQIMTFSVLLVSTISVCVPFSYFQSTKARKRFCVSFSLVGVKGMRAPPCLLS